MSYALVELEIDGLVNALLVAQKDPEAGFGSMEEAVENLFVTIQTGMERHIEECVGVVEALKDARAKLERVSSST